MNIDLNKLNNSNIDISGKYDIPSSYYENSDIIRLDPLEVSGEISLDEEENEIIDCTIKGNMILPDTISLEEVDYPFTIEFSDIIPETAKKSKNILDIFEFLWENIVLEVPLQFTKVEDLSKFHGDGWKLISEESLKRENNPFSDLLNDYDKE